MTGRKVNRQCRIDGDPSKYGNGDADEALGEVDADPEDETESLATASNTIPT